MTYIGIDNGLDGGIVAVNGAEIISQMVTPTKALGKGRMVDLFKLDIFLGSFEEPVTVIVETAMKHSAGNLALCSTWFSFGMIRATLELREFRFHVITPQVWQKEFWTRPKLAKNQKFDTKAAALNAASQLWPRHDWTKSERAVKAHDGLVDAALIAEYGRRKNL